MGKKRDVVISSVLKKNLENVIDLAQFKADRERASMTGEAAEEALKKILRWLPTVDELEAAGPSLRRMLRFQGLDGRTFFGIAANAAGKASSFFGAESADGTTGSLAGLEWFIVARLAVGRPPVILRQSDLAAIASSGAGGPTPASSVGTIQPLVRDQAPVNEAG